MPRLAQESEFILYWLNKAPLISDVLKELEREKVSRRGTKIVFKKKRYTLKQRVFKIMYAQITNQYSETLVIKKHRPDGVTLVPNVSTPFITMVDQNICPSKPIKKKSIWSKLVKKVLKYFEIRNK